MRLRCTLLTDGTSDRTLLHVLGWLFARHAPLLPVELEWADPVIVGTGHGLDARRIVRALEFYPADLLFLHRDAEAMALDARRAQIAEVLHNWEATRNSIPAVMVVPVRMTEAWLLFDEAAIRRAAERPNGQEDLDLPPLHRWEDLPDPKRTLHEALLRATGKTGRHLQRFRPGRAVHRVVELIDDFSPLLNLPAFTELDKDLRDTLQRNGWLEY